MIYAQIARMLSSYKPCDHILTLASNSNMVVVTVTNTCIANFIYGEYDYVH